MIKLFLTGLNPFKGILEEHLRNKLSANSGKGKIDVPTLIANQIKNLFLVATVVISLLSSFYYVTGDLEKAKELKEIGSELKDQAPE